MDAVLKPHGGPRKNAGRPKGVEKVRMSVLVLPATAKEIERRAFKLSVSLGSVLDKILSKFC
jgi:hypothetical protein